MVAPGPAVAGVPWQPEFANTEGAQSQLPVFGSGHHSGDEPIESLVSGPGDQLPGTDGLPDAAARAVVEAVDPSRRPSASGPVVPTAGTAAAVAQGSPSSLAGRKPSSALFSNLAPDPRSGTDPSGFAASHRADAPSLSQQTALLELCWLGRRHPRQCGISDHRRADLPSPPCRGHSRPESHSQSPPERSF